MTPNLEEWFNKLIIKFKEEYGELPKSKKQKLNFITDLNDISLIESLWIQNEDSDLQFHLFFIKPGEKLEINCEKLDNADYLETLNERLHEIHSKVYLSDEYNLKYSEKDFFNNLVAIFSEGVQRFANVKGSPEIVKKYLVSPNCFCWINTGKINEIEVEKIINEIFSNSKDSLKSESPLSGLHYNGYVAFFYPSIWIGKHPKVSFEEGWSLKKFTKIVMKKTNDDKLLIIRNDGLVTVLETDKKAVLRILNDIMATAAFLGIPSSIVREPDLLKVNINTKYQRSGNDFSDSNSTVTILDDELTSMSSIKEFRRIKIKEEKIPELFFTLETFNVDKDYKNFLIFYLESKSFFRAGAYPQSFLMSWIIVERYLSLLWEREVILNLETDIKSTINKEKRKKLKNQNVDTIIKKFYSMKIIEPDNYDTLMDLKQKRNKIVHEGLGCTKDEAKECLNFAQFVFKGIEPNNQPKILELLLKTLRINQVNYKNIIADLGQVEAAEKRDNGHEFCFNEHLKALVYSLLSNQRRWIDIVDKVPQINEVFLNFDSDKLENYDTEDLLKEIKKIKVGNISINKQISALPHNIRQLKKIEKDFGTLDNFVIHDSPSKVVKLLSKGDSEYKIKQMGDALALEYLKNVGIRGMKPDVHINRICGPERLDIIPSKDTKKQLEEFKNFAESVNVSETYLDNLIWIFGADGFGEICTEHPKCHQCELKSYCNHMRI